MKWSESRFLLLLLMLQDKIKAIACGTYGATDVTFSPEAEAAIERFTGMGFDKLPICMAKTQYSFSHDATLKGGLAANHDDGNFLVAVDLHILWHCLHLCMEPICPFMWGGSSD